ncbi:MAG: PaaI family thioesterase [Firmicutes bacterium]|jgi:uncharacterized protein (TIGR00369 family)|nr:PaaI family thioesterase [Bacillota bacterium]
MNTKKQITLSPYLELIGVKLEEVKYPRARLSLQYRKDLVNPMGTLHGGVISSLVDAVLGCALLSQKEIKGIATLELKVNYLNPVTSGTVVAEGEIIHRKGLMAFGQAFIYCEKKLIAVGSNTNKLTLAKGETPS